jgi:hypothetical protein
MWRGFWPTAAFAGSMTVAVSAAPANDFKVRLVVRSDVREDGCPQPEHLAQAVHKIVGRPVFDRSERAPDFIEVDIRREASDFVAVVKTGGPRKTVRELRVPKDQGCGQLSEVLPLTLSLIVDSLEWQRSRTTRESPASAPKPPDQTARLGATAETGGWAATGLLHDTSPVFFGDLGFRSHAGHGLSLGFLRSSQPAFAYGNGMIALSLWAVSLRGCGGLVGSDKARLLACLMPAAGASHASAQGYVSNDAVTRPWFAVAAELVFRGRSWEPLEWSARVGGLVPIKSDAFTVNGLGTAHQPSKVAAYGGIGVGVSF